MKPINKNILKFKFLFFLFLFLFLALYCFSCTEKQLGCFDVVDLNYSEIKENPSRGPILFGIQGEKVLKQIVAENMFGDFYDSNIKNLFIVLDQDTLDYLSKIKLKKKSDKMTLRLPTGRYRWEFKDSISAMDQIKKEHLILELYNGEIIKLNYCDK